MKKQQNKIRKLFISIRMNEDEVNQLKKRQQQTTERSLSEYIRRVSMQKPVIVKHRNESADDFLRSMLELKKELNGIGNNFNQAVHKLHLLDKIPEFRIWLHQYDWMQKLLTDKIEEIELRLMKLYEELLIK